MTRDGPGAATWENVTLGAEPVLGFEESGFHAPEQIEGAPGRWTNGLATLKVPLSPRALPRRLEIETTAPGRRGARLRLRANGEELWHGRVPPDTWAQTFDLEKVRMERELLIELASDTFTPAERYEGSTDERRLGVAVRGIRLTSRDR